MKTDIASPQVDQSPSTGPRFDVGWIFRQDLGQIPVAIALILMALYFNATTNDLFLSARNLSNLTIQSCVIATVGLGSIMVLLLGEIDLSLAVVANMCGAIMCIVSVFDHFPWWAAILMGLLSGFAIGIINGIFVAILRVPSFIVTLAASLGYQGLLLHILLPNTTLIITDPNLKAIAANYLPDYLGIGIPVLGVTLYAGYIIYSRLRRQQQGLSVPPLWQTALTIGIAGALVALILWQFENYFGVPIMPILVVGMIALFWIVLRFTTFGQHIYAIGGNAEASRRAGINVNVTRIIVFGLASTLAAAAGIFQASRSADADAAVSPTLLLQAIAAAVIGGVSLFGGRGSAWAVVMGTLVIVGLENGLNLKSSGVDIKFMVEGAVLILAVIVDALLRRRSSAAR
jgi:D-xylose transport system permease protein